jgi:hypothetical protein
MTLTQLEQLLAAHQEKFNHNSLTAFSYPEQAQLMYRQDVLKALILNATNSPEMLAQWLEHDKAFVEQMQKDLENE